MDIFKRKKTELPPLLSDADLIDYNSVVEWLAGLSESDYDKVIGVAEVYRHAAFQECEILKVPIQPTTFINSPDDPITDEIPFLDHKPQAKKGTTKNAK